MVFLSRPMTPLSQLPAASPGLFLCQLMNLLSYPWYQMKILSCLSLVNSRLCISLSLDVFRLLCWSSQALLVCEMARINDQPLSWPSVTLCWRTLHAITCSLIYRVSSTFCRKICPFTDYYLQVPWTGILWCAAKLCWRCLIRWLTHLMGMSHFYPHTGRESSDGHGSFSLQPIRPRRPWTQRH